MCAHFAGCDGVVIGHRAEALVELGAAVHDRFVGRDRVAGTGVLDHLSIDLVQPLDRDTYSGRELFVDRTLIIVIPAV
ncbi:hypothetical protein [Nocardia sp. NPDC059228]|uniref:hypothetical protein n=1 Tax=Nocardia sp. NPDC059228 TaxID=3346777 RepID=UPI0036B04737